MARRKVQFAVGEYYHIYNRGCDKGKIFLADENYDFLLRLLEVRVREFHTTVIAYCLMPNHYHFLLRQDNDKSAGAMIQSLFNSYTKAFNSMYGRTGTLFEGPFKAIHVDKEHYLLHLSRYIHRNPLEAGLVHDLELWRYSNYLEWIKKRDSIFVDRSFVESSFASPTSYVQFVHEYEAPEKLKRALRKYVID